MGDNAETSEVVTSEAIREEASSVQMVSKHTVTTVESSHMESKAESVVHVESVVEQSGAAVIQQEVSQTHSITAAAEETAAVEAAEIAIEPQPVDENANSIPDEPDTIAPPPASEPEPIPEPAPEPEVETVSEPVVEAAPEPEPVAEAAPEPEPAPEPAAEAAPEAVAEPVAEAAPEAVLEPVEEPSPVVEAPPPPAAEEISQENIKTQLHEIISEIEQEVIPEQDEVKETEAQETKPVEEAMPLEASQPVVEPQPVAITQPVAVPQLVDGQVPPGYEGEMEEYEYYDEDGTLHHTWRPRGKYNVQKTEILYEDVVPIQVPDVKLAPVIQKPPSQQAAMPAAAPPGVITNQMPNNVEGLTNGGDVPFDLAHIEIPEGIPLLARILPKTDQGLEGDKKISLERLFTPATDSGDLTPIKKKAFASSAFYGPNHPTIDDQVELAQRISFSLVDDNNKMSRGQSMYMKRKKRSMRWIHQGEEGDEDYEGPGMEMLDEDGMRAPEKPAMKLLMSSKGVQDFHQVQEHYQNLMNQAPPSPEVNKVVSEISSPSGKGAELFAKRKKRMDKFIVDETTVQKSQQTSITQQSSAFSSSSVSSSSLSSSQNVSSKSQSNKNKKEAEAVRDKEQEKIMEEFIRNRSASIVMVKSPWNAALETGCAADAFEDKRTKLQLADIVCERAEIKSSSVPRWMELPKPVPISTGVSIAAPAAAPGSGAIYTAEVKVVQRASLPPTPVDVPHHSLLDLVTVDEKSDKRRSASFNLAAKGWGTYNNFYKAVTFATKS